MKYFNHPICYSSIKTIAKRQVDHTNLKRRLKCTSTRFNDLELQISEKWGQENDYHFGLYVQFEMRIIFVLLLFSKHHNYTC